ncbi:hypothetical protein LBMAG24_09630 [Bacteroidota bacterium]|nr:hypothetical protein LBMAG24_09630 [Bacteroidota bacterium]
MFVLTCSIIQLTISGLLGQECFETHATKYQGGFHSNIMVRPDNKVVIWGDPTPMGILYSPTLVPMLYDGADGKVIEVGTAGSPWNDNGWGQGSMFIRTTTKLYGFGIYFLPAVFNTGPTPSWGTSFQDLTSQLPAGVGPGDIYNMINSRENISLITRSGDLWIKTTHDFNVLGNGSIISPNRKQWFKATISKVKKFQAYRDAAIALTENGNVYVWGAGVLLGDGSAAKNYNIPTLLDNFYYGSKTAVDVACVKGPNFYIHTSDGRVYSWGANGVSLGNNNTTSTTPRTIKLCDGSELSDIVKIDGANESGLSCIGFLNSENTLFNLGENNSGMLSGTPNYTCPLKVTSSLFRDFTYGGHYTVGFKLNSCGEGLYCYCGHRINGSIGDGSTNSGFVQDYLCLKGIFEFFCLQSSYDYGDAPASYHNGNTPKAGMNITLSLGATRDFNPGPVPVAAGADAGGTAGDGADEDALVLPMPIIEEGSTDSVIFQIKIKNQTECNANLYAWIDWDKDGKFELIEAAPAQVSTHNTQALTDYYVRFKAPGTQTSGRTYLRFFLSKNGLADDASTAAVDERSLGVSSDGEIEDYGFMITPQPDGPPIITTQPTGADKCLGLAHTLSVSIDQAKSGKVNYQWQKKAIGANDNTYTDVPNATKNTLIFNPVTALDEGTYRCKLTNTYKTNNPGLTYSNPVNLKPITTAEFKF